VSTPEELYAALKADIAALAEPLFEFSEKCLRQRGNFLPHGAILKQDGEIELVAAAPDGPDKTTSIEVLPLLHAGLRSIAKEKQAVATAVAENVTVTPDGGQATQAIKVLFEHQRGLTTALYLPFSKRFLRGYTFGDTFSVLAPPEVNAWGAP
jgi:hypothetical protein